MCTHTPTPPPNLGTNNCTVVAFAGGTVTSRGAVPPPAVGSWGARGETESRSGVGVLRASPASPAGPNPASCQLPAVQSPDVRGGGVIGGSRAAWGWGGPKQTQRPGK